MVFPRRALIISSLTGGFLWFMGFPRWAAFLFSFFQFLGIGGLKYCRLIYRTLPTDLWMGRNLLNVVSLMKRGIKERLVVSDHFQATAKKHPDKVAIMFEDKQFTFAEVDEASNRIANMLCSSTHLQHGDTVAVFMENCPEYIILYLALSKIGVTGAFINYNLRGDSLAHCIRIANCTALFFGSSLSDAVAEVLPGLELQEGVYCVDGDCTLPQAKSLEELSRNASVNSPPAVAKKSALDKMCYIYTSGTTGLPKACNMKHNRFYSLAYACGLYSRVRADDVVYVTLPLYHTNGGVLGVGQMLFNGCTVVIRKKFSASNFWPDCIKYKCTVSFYIGELCRYILAQPKRPVDTQHCIRLMIGNGLKAQIWPDFTRRFQIPQISEFYGSTEGNVGMINPFNKVGACGRISVLLAFLNPVRLVKVNPDTGEYVRNSEGFCIEAGFNEPGEVVGRIRKNVITSHFEGYSDSKASKKKVMSDVFVKGDQYFLSGDILREDEDGFLYFCDRTGDTFRWKGENVSTAEVEAVVSNFLQLRDVVVYGVEVPGNEGRAGMAAITGTKESVDLSGLAQQLFLSLPNYAVPLFVRIIPEAELTGTFKLKKVQLRKEGFDISLPDPVFILDMSRKAYQPLTEELYHQLQNGGLRV